MQSTDINTNNNLDLALRVFTQRVQQRAMCIVDNMHAGTTRDELHFIRKYFYSHRAESLTLAIISCACAMLDALRPSELER